MMSGYYEMNGDAIFCRLVTGKDTVYMGIFMYYGFFFLSGVYSDEKTFLFLLWSLYNLDDFKSTSSIFSHTICPGLYVPYRQDVYFTMSCMNSYSPREHEYI